DSVMMMRQPATAERVREAYEAHAAEFRAWSPSRDFKTIVENSVAAEVERLLRVRQKMVRVLEIGCGDGAWAEALYARAGAAGGAGGRIAYEGIDISKTRVEFARARLAERGSATVRVCDAETFQPDGPVDLVAAIEVLSHWGPATHRRWMTRWAGWLAPGGAV